MNKPDLIGLTLLIPYLIILYYIQPLYSIILSLIYLIILVNLVIISRSYFKNEASHLWIVPASYLVYYGLNMILSELFTPGLFFFILLFLSMAVYGGGYGELSRYNWIYIIVLASIFILTPLLGLRYYLFYLATPVIDYLWIRGFSSAGYLDIILSSIVIVLIYLPLASIMILLILGLAIIRVPLYLRGLDTYMMFIDYYIRLFYGWLIGFGY